MVDKEQPLEAMATVMLAESPDCRPVTVLSLICQMAEVSLWAVRALKCPSVVQTTRRVAIRI